MPSCEMKFPQAGVLPESIQGRLRVVRGYLQLTKMMHAMAFPGAKKGWGSDIELLLVLMCVFVGDASGRPVSASKIVIHVGLSRATVYRRIETLMALGKIVRIGRLYYLAPNMMSPDPLVSLSKILSDLNLS